jgi:UDP:flavonoid glycosyltransferase YjiC (YdhE family)
MPALAYDVLLISDLRLPGPTGRTIAAEIRAQATAGYRTALLHVKSPLLSRPHPVNPLIRRAIEDGLADWLDPDVAGNARLAVAHHPGVFAEPPARVPRLVAEQKLLVVNHPLLDPLGRAYFDRSGMLLGVEDLLGPGVRLAPTGPQIRAQLAALGWPPPLLDRDWPPVLEADQPATTTPRAWSGRVVIGRRGELDQLAWPPQPLLLSAYPDDPDLEVRVLADPRRLAALLGGLPAGWTVVDPKAATVGEFLARLDCYVHLGADAVQPVRLEIIEALASRVPVVLPAALAADFGEAAAYVEAGGLRAAIRGLEDPSTRAALAERAGDLVARRFSPAAHVERLRALIGPPAARRSLVLRRERRPRQRVLFLSSNGIGMGHLTRLLAIARRCPPAIEPVFLAMSQAAGVVEEFGYLVEFTGHHIYLDLDVERWNQALRAQIHEMIGFYDARAVLFDGNVPYRGLIDARLDHPSLPFLWCRRGMWLPRAGRVALDRARYFDAVLEPRDLAESYERGETVYHGEHRRPVDSVLLLDRDELLDRAAARAELGLDPERPAILIQLGSRNNYDYGELFEIAHAHLRRRYDVQIAVAEWLIAEAAQDLPPGAIPLQTYPLCRYFRAFDGAISAVGYNSYHELIHYGLPAIFVPNEHPSMDDQLMRALFAARRGLGLCVRTAEPYRIRDALDRLMDPTERAAIAGRCRALATGNGAPAAAALVEEMVLSLPAAALPPWAGGMLRHRRAGRRV